MHLSPNYAKMIKVLKLKFYTYLPFPDSCYMFYSLHHQRLNCSNNILGYNKASNALYSQVSSNNVEIFWFSQRCWWSVESSAKWRCAVWWDCLTLKIKTIRYSETSGIAHTTTGCHIQECLNLHPQPSCREFEEKNVKAIYNWK